jgi:hypothetical protein
MVMDVLEPQLQSNDAPRLSAADDKALDDFLEDYRKNQPEKKA